MTQTTARITKAGKHFEILVDLEDALKFRKGEISEIQAEGGKIFRDLKKGEKVSPNDLTEVFGTTDINEVVKKIVKQGEVLTTQEQRSTEHEKKFRQVVDFLSKNAFNPQTGNPHTPERIKSALEQAHINIKNVPIENQINEILGKINTLIPIKLEIKKIKLTIPAIHTGKVYGLVNQYKEEETWLNNGDLKILVNVPSGIILDFYDKLNSMTQGSVLTEEIKEGGYKTKN